MNRALAISAITLVAVVMGVGAIAPALATNIPLAFSDGCPGIHPGKACVSIDRDHDGICDIHSWLIPTKAARNAGIHERCAEFPPL